MVFLTCRFLAFTLLPANIPLTLGSLFLIAPFLVTNLIVLCFLFFVYLLFHGPTTIEEEVLGSISPSPHEIHEVGTLVDDEEFYSQPHPFERPLKMS